MDEKRKYNKQPNIITRSSDSMTLIEKRAIYLVINQMETGYNLQEDLFQNIKFEIPLSIFGESNYRQLKQSLTKLQSRSITLIDNIKTNSFTRIIPFPKVEINSTHIVLTMFAEIVPYFAELKKGYTKYELEAALSLYSVYSQKMYELLSRWKDKKEWIVEVEELKLLLNATNYKYSDFKKRCITPALDEINKKTDLTAQLVSENKVGRQVNSLHFKIKAIQNIPSENFENEIKDFMQMTSGEIAVYVNRLMKEYTFTKDQIDQIISNRNLLNEFIELESKIANGVIKNVKDPTAYMAVSLFKLK